MYYTDVKRSTIFYILYYNFVCASSFYYDFVFGISNIVFGTLNFKDYF